MAPQTVTEEISSLLAAYALDALSPEETAYIEYHLPNRPAWQEELAGYKRVAGLLPYASPQQQVPVRARAAILARIDALAIEQQEEALARVNRSQSLRSRLRRWPVTMPKVAWAAAVPATAIAIVFIITSLVMQERITEQEAELAAFQQEQSKVTDVLLADDSGQQVVDLIQSSNAPLARGRLIINEDDNSAMLVVRDMPPPANGGVYVVWMLIGANHEEYARLGELTVDELGRGQKILDPPDAFSQYPFVRITIEPSADGGIPTGPEVMTGSIRPLDTR